jgi:hypothetical protein
MPAATALPAVLSVGVLEVQTSIDRPRYQPLGNEFHVSGSTPRQTPRRCDRGFWPWRRQSNGLAIFQFKYKKTSPYNFNIEYFYWFVNTITVCRWF